MPAIDTGSKPRLNADLSGTQLSGFVCAPDNFLGRQKVAFFGQMPSAESAKTTSFDTNVGEVDVAIDDVGNNVAHGLRAQIIRGCCQCREVGAVRVEKTRCLIDRNVRAGQGVIQYVADGRANSR